MAFYKLIQSEDGDVRDAQGVRYFLSGSQAIGTPRGMNHGYKEFPTRAEALAHFQVTDIPEEELYPQPSEE